MSDTRKLLLMIEVWLPEGFTPDEDALRRYVTGHAQHTVDRTAEIERAFKFGRAGSPTGILGTKGVTK
jgi:hypothetical protein